MASSTSPTLTAPRPRSTCSGSPSAAPTPSPPASWAPSRSFSASRRGWYDPEALQVFNRRQRGGRYWFTHGRNWRGMTAWWVSALTAVLFTNIPGQFVGPLGDLANGSDIRLPLSLVVAAVLYLALLRIFPEPRAVYGPKGARLARTVEVAVPPITGPGAGVEEGASAGLRA